MKRLILSLSALMASIGSVIAQTADNTVDIFFNGTSATVSVAANISSYITVTSGSSSHVKLVQSGSVNESVGEITYTLSGTSTDGEFFMEGSYKASFELNGLTLTNPSGPAINIQDGKRIKMSVKNGTINKLTDGANADYNGCIHCKGHLEMKGKGELTVTGNSKHGIYSKEYMQVKNCTINITAAAKDGIHCKEYFLMESGNISIANATDDGIQVEIDDNISATGVTAEHEDENTGNFYMLDGILSISNYGSKAVVADGSLNFNGGTQNFDMNDTKSAVNLLKQQNSANNSSVAYDLAGRSFSAKTQAGKGLYLVKKDGKYIKVVK